MSEMGDFVQQHAVTLARVQRYGQYWNLMWNNTDVSHRNNATRFALKRITDALKEMNLLNEWIREWNTFTAVGSNEFDQARRRMATIEKCLDDAWGWMTFDYEQAAFVFDENWDPNYRAWRDIASQNAQRI